MDSVGQILIFLGLLVVAHSMPSTKALGAIADELANIRRELQKITSRLPR